jgi:hypothetical protein
MLASMLLAASTFASAVETAPVTPAATPNPTPAATVAETITQGVVSENLQRGAVSRLEQRTHWRDVAAADRRARMRKSMP